MRPSFFHHLHPPTIPRGPGPLALHASGGWSGGLPGACPGSDGHSGNVLLHSHPRSSRTFRSNHHVPCALSGALVRNLHFWSAQLLLIVIAVHLVRVVFTGAYAQPRRFNYLLGLALFVFAVLLDFTGYVLRWDVGVQWALVVGTNLIKTIPWIGTWLYVILTGATQPNIASADPLLFLAHIRVDAGRGHPSCLAYIPWSGAMAASPSRLPRCEAINKRITRYELVRREVLAMLFSGAALVMLAIFLQAPLNEPIKARTAEVFGNARAPWFFLWVQQMLEWGDPFFWGVLIPLLLLMYW